MDVFASFELIYRNLSRNLKKESMTNELRANISKLAHSYCNSYKPSRNTLRKHGILQRLRKMHDIVILRPDKGNAVVIMDRSMYDSSLLTITTDSRKIVKLEEDPTMKRETSLKNFLCALKRKNCLDGDIYKQLYPTGSQPARIYGLPKIHKLTSGSKNPPLRPIVSSLGTYNYNLAKYLNEMLTPLVPTRHSITDSFTFVEEVRNADIVGKFMVSFDVESLFTNIPLKETIDLAVDAIITNKVCGKLSRAQLTKLFMYATSMNHFLFKGCFYDQIDGVAMGSPLGPTLANLFMGHHEQRWIEEFNECEVLMYRRYVDDIFCVFHNKDDALKFYQFINSKHTNIKFTYETAYEGRLPFLDILIENYQIKPVTSVYHKPTFTGLYTNFRSFVPFLYKVGLIRGLLFRAFHICSTWEIFHHEVQKIHRLLHKNSFPQHLLDKVTKSFFAKLNNSQTARETSGEDKDIKYFKLPYIGRTSSLTQARLKQITHRFCKKVNINLVFVPLKIGSYFSVKDKIAKIFKSRVIYRFCCIGCNAKYIGLTTRHLGTRISEHLKVDKCMTTVAQHLKQSPDCLNVCDSSCFEIIDMSATESTLRIKEALYILEEKPNLKIQVKHENVL